MKTFKELRKELSEAKKSKVRTKTSAGVRPDINLGPDISGQPTQNLPAVRPQGTTNLPAVRPQGTANLPAVRPQTNVEPSSLGKLGRVLGRIGSGVGLALEPSELGAPETEADYEKEMKKHKEKNPTASMGPKQRARYLEKNKPVDGEYIPKAQTGTEVVTKQRSGETIDVKPETKPKTKIETKPKTQTQTQTQTKPKTQTQTQTKPKTQTQTKIEKKPSPFTAPPSPPGGGGGDGGKPGGPVGGSPAKPPSKSALAAVPDPNLGGGFVTAGISKGPSGELRRVNVSRGKVDQPALPHKKTGLDIPLQKAKNVEYAKPQDWKQASPEQVIKKKLPPQGSSERDVVLKSMGYKKF